ncbi:MAG: hypothetical protein SFU98_06080 [Leptospiraceae bacterium]|nr:hypothetical protein [Leptospiraceae bacterium]
MKLIYILLVYLTIINCQSDEVKIIKATPKNAKSLGMVEGESSCGMLLGGPTAYNFIPIFLNDRVEGAYENALKKAPKAKALTKISIKEDWFWALGFVRCMSIKGEALTWE